MEKFFFQSLVLQRPKICNGMSGGGERERGKEMPEMKQNSTGDETYRRTH